MERHQSNSQQQQQPQQSQQQQPHEPVHCFWALMTYGDLRFIYLSSSVQRAVSAEYKQLLGKSFFDYIHPDEAKLARKDLNAFMDVHNLYGSVTRCRFKNVCPEWRQRKLARQPGSTVPASVLQAAATEEGLSSRGLGSNGLQPNDTSTATLHNDSSSSLNNDKLCALSAAAVALAESQQSPSDPQKPTNMGCKDYEDIFQNGEEDDFMILDVVMNVVSDEVVLGFFHIDGQGLYKGFWSNGICGESKESVETLAPEIMRHLQDSVIAKNTSSETLGSPSHHQQDSESWSSTSVTSPRRRGSDHRTKRIFQIYDSHNRNLLLTWPEPGNHSEDSGTMAYNPELYTQIVKSHHIPADVLENTTCLKRFCSKHALPNLNPTTTQAISYQVESVFIPYGHIIFACFQTSPSTPISTWTMLASPSTSVAASQGSILASPSSGSRSFGSTIDGVPTHDHLSGLGLMSMPGQPGSNLLGVGSNQGSTPSALNSPLVIPSLPSLSPFLKHAVAGQMTIASGVMQSSSPTGAIRNITGSAGSHSPLYHHPYSRNSGLSTSPSSSASPSNLPLPEAMQESLSFLNDYKAGDFGAERGEGPPSGGRQPSDMRDHTPSIWHASTPHPAIAAMVGHVLAPSAPAFQRTVDSRPSHSRAKSSSAEAYLQSTLAGSVDIHGSNSDLKSSIKLSTSPRHPAHDAAIRKRSLSSGSSSSPPASYADLDSTGGTSGSKAATVSSGSRGRHVLRVTQEEKSCESCGTTNSPEWRRGQSGKKDLCNACGLRYSRSVARQNRQAQKLLGGKTKKPKKQKTGKAAKEGQSEPDAGDSGPGESSAGNTLAQNRHQQQPQQQQQQQQQQQSSHLPLSFASESYSDPGMSVISISLSLVQLYQDSLKLSSSNYTPSTRSSPEPTRTSPTLDGAENAPQEESEEEVEFLHTPSPSILCPVLEIEPFCPLCRARIKIEDLHPNLALAGLISELLVYCSNKKYGCPQIVRQDALHGHVLYCSYAPSVCPNKNLGCPYKGTMRNSKEHLQNCVYERFKGYIESTNKRFEKLESLLADQSREIEKLQRIIRSGKSVVYDANISMNGGTSPTAGKAGVSQHEESSSSSGTKRTVVSTFPHDEITCHRTIANHACGVTSVAVNQDIVFAGAHDGSTKVFDINTGNLLKDSKGHTMSVWGLAVMPSGDRYFSAGSDGTIRVWDWRNEDPEACLVKTIPDHLAKVYGLVIDQGRLYSASSDKTIKVWDTETLECLATFQGHTGGVNCLAALTDSSAHRLVTGSSDKTIKLWDVTTGTCLNTVRRGTSEVLDVAVGDGMLFGSTYDAVIHVYDLNETRELGTLSGHNWEVWQLEYAQGHLFSGSFDHTIKRWDPRRFQCDLTLKGHKSFVHGMALTDKYLVTGCADRTIKIWR
ncbi:hypothetical protein BGZ50_005838 [Haplosporangium sp. Z 11]|nr:hypothetical protein BGZ50_005838 [Haplosporangium sp. Z 11]